MTLEPEAAAGRAQEAKEEWGVEAARLVPRVSPAPGEKAVAGEPVVAVQAAAPEVKLVEAVPVVKLGQAASAVERASAAPRALAEREALVESQALAELAARGTAAKVEPRVRAVRAELQASEAQAATHSTFARISSH